jgi:hypothetical protein
LSIHQVNNPDNGGNAEGRAGATPTVATTQLDMARVQRWAELLDGDPQARQFMREHVAGGELTELTALTQRARRLELALQHGIPEQLAEVHLTADDPALLAQQAESLARLLQSRADIPVGQNQAYIQESDKNIGPTAPLPYYEAAPVSGDEWLQQQFVRLYQQ